MKSRLEGFKECREVLQEMSKIQQRNVGRRALEVPANIIAQAVSAKAPVSTDPNNPTPNSLKQSPVVGKEPTKRGEGPRNNVTVDDPAGVPNEFGLTRRDYPANPFFRPAVDATKNVAINAFAAALKPEVLAMAAKIARKAQKAK